MFDIQNIVDACGQVVTQTEQKAKSGTGYLIEADCVATCWHVVDKAVPNGIKLKFQDGEVRASIGAANPESDCALLMLEQPLKTARALTLGGECKWKAPWDGYGYPQAGRNAGLTIEGVVRNPRAIDDQKAPVLELFSPDVAAGMAAPLHGWSGSPVVVNEMVVGHLKRFVADPEDPARPAYGKVYATRSECILALRAAVGARPPQPTPPVSPPTPGTAHAVDTAKRIEDLFAKWHADPVVPDELAGQAAVESLIQLGAPEKALQVALKLPYSLRQRQLEALALAKTEDFANIDRSILILEELRDKHNHLDAETSGILGGRFKQLYLQKKEPKYLQQSYDVYIDAFQRTKDWYPGINAAALALWMKNKSTSTNIAHEVLMELDKTPAAKVDCWHMATKGEAYLLANDIGRAKVWYGKAAETCDYAPGTIKIMQNQANLNLKALGLDPGVLDVSFKK